MKNFTRLLLALAVAGSTGAYAQRLPASGPTVPVNWRPTTNPASLSLDLDGDAFPDVQFDYRFQTPSGPGTIDLRSFVVGCYASNSTLELAVDASEYISAHRYQAGDLLEGPVRWQRTNSASGIGSSYLEYVVNGNGGIGGWGLFRNNATGYIVLRKVLGSSAQYWWLYIGPRISSTDSWVQYYGTSVVALATSSAAGPAVAPAFPNPSATGWQLPQPAAYQLLDAQGRLVGQSPRPVATVAAADLAPGCYTLLLRLPDGTLTRQQLVKP